MDDCLGIFDANADADADGDDDNDNEQVLRPLPPHRDIAWHDLLARFCQPLIGFGQDPAEHSNFLRQHVEDVIDVLYMVGGAIERMTVAVRNERQLEGELPHTK